MCKHPDGAGVVLHTADGQILLHRRDRNAPDYVGYWALFGGQIEDDEAGKPKDAACRELRCELDGFELDPGALQHLCCIRIIRPSRFPIIHYFVAFLTRRLSELRLKKEGDALGLFSHDDIDRLPVRLEDRLAIERYFQGREFGYLTDCSTCGQA